MTLINDLYQAHAHMNVRSNDVAQKSQAGIFSSEKPATWTSIQRECGSGVSP